jgi:1,2-dihydroxy-3-keto-5-methylthiopentene dioxygenase
MSQLRVFADDDPRNATLVSNDQAEIAHLLSAKSVRFERWVAAASVVAGDSQEDIIAEYRNDIDRLIEADGYQAVDVVSLTADHPDKEKLRQTFLSEHTHSEDEVRFFVDGQGLFSLHIDHSVYEVLCQKGDLISVPANTPHWFDMGPNPNFVAIRLFNNPDGWVANYSGSEIAAQFSRLEN